LPEEGREVRLIPAQYVKPQVKTNTVLFPRSGCEELLGQIFNLGVESHG
jgi:hypothetical protein